MKQRIIINTSNLQKGGALQVALSVAKEADVDENYEFHIILGRASKTIIEKSDFTNSTFHEVDFHASDSPISFLKFKRELAKIEKKVNPIGVISIFGPCYWKPKSAHVLGFANGYLLYEDTYFFSKNPVNKSIQFQLKKHLHRLLLKREAKLYWTETNDSKARLSRFLNVPASKIQVASNNASNYFSTEPFEALDQLPTKETFRLAYISSYYPHKGFEILKEIMEYFKETDEDIELVLTLDTDNFDRLFGALSKVHNLGTIHPKYCPAVYASADVIVIPSLLETFSASYPEAMIAKKPIVTSDLPFAKDICKSAASYYNPSSFIEATEKILELKNSSHKRDQLVESGLKRVTEFDSPKSRYSKIVSHLQSHLPATTTK